MLKEYLKRNGTRLLDRYSRTGWFRFLSPVNFTLWKAVEQAALKHARGDLLDAGAGRRPYEKLLNRLVSAYVSTDVRQSKDEGIDHVADLHTLDLGRRFDTILCSQVLEHCQNPERVIGRLEKHLAPGGRLTLTAPHLSMLHNEPHDYFRFTEYGLRAMLERAGLEAVETRKIGGIVVFLGHIGSTFALNLTFGVPVLGYLALCANVPWVLGAVLADRVAGFSSLFPANQVVIAKRTSDK